MLKIKKGTRNRIISNYNFHKYLVCQHVFILVAFLPAFRADIFFVKITHDWVTKNVTQFFLVFMRVFELLGTKSSKRFYRRCPTSKPQLNPPQRGFRLIFQVGSPAFLRFPPLFPVIGSAEVLVLYQDLVQVKMRNFSQIQPASSSDLACAFLYTRSNSSGDIKSQ